jgi:glycosyltransferase involved in cell wall biosynthesis
MTPKLALCMIVKNESHIIEQCLNSIYKYIDYWVISDTGSTDGTQEIIQNFFKEKGIPGELHQDEWKNFGHNRTLALRHCDGKAQYAWMIDADDVVEGEFIVPTEMTADGYVIRMGKPEFSWWRSQIFKTESKWEYKGVLHEYPNCTGVEKPALSKIEGNYRINARTLGARNVGITPVEKYTKDAEVLEEALKEEPENTRYQFYLAQSYFDSQQWDKAIQAYQRRIDMGGWAEEVYYSKYRIAVCKATLAQPIGEIINAFLDAYNYRPIRAEPLVHIAQMLRQLENKPAAAFVFARQAAEIPLPPNEILFVPNFIYQFAALDEVGASAHAAGRPEIGYLACKKLLEENRVPAEHLERVINNFNQYTKIMQQIGEERKKFEQLQNPPAPKEEPKKVNTRKQKKKVKSK